MMEMELRPHCTSSLICVLLLASCACALLIPGFSAFFPHQLQLFWPRSRSAVLYTNSYDHNNTLIPPSPAPTNLSHILFVIGASANTWHKRRTYTELWWRPNITRGHVWLDQAPPAPWPHTCPPYRISRDQSRYGNRASASRMAAAVVEAYQLVSSGPDKDSVRWFVMGDDDTVFFLENLVTVLQKYDHMQMYYVGTPSESVEQDVKHGYGMAFGGGGFAISYPAVAEMAGIMDACLERYTSLYGSDQRIHSCLAELGVPLTREPGFHQVDLRGDVYGMLAAHPVAPLVSLHHLDYVKPVIPNKPNQLESLQFLLSVYQVDPARILQQAICYDMGMTMSISVSWGYTVQVYPWLVFPYKLESPLQTFKTWMSNDGPFIFKTRPLGDACAHPFIFLLEGVLQQQNPTDGTSVTQYSRQTDHGASEAKCEKEGFSAAAGIETVRVVAPKMDPSMWKQAPRRHCCGAQRTEGGRLLQAPRRHCCMMRRTNWVRLLEVGIKYCSPGESLLN